MPTFGLYHRIVVTDKNGKVKRKTRWKKSKSWNIGFLQHLQFMMIHAYGVVAQTITIADITNTARTFGPATTAYDYFLSAYGADNDGSYGIVLGTGVTAVGNTDYKLATIIAHGTGSEQLDYGSSSFTAAAVVGANVDMILSRAFYNGSGATITVKEMGIYVDSYSTDGVVHAFLICRDLIAAVDILDTETASAQYVFRTTA